MEKKHGSQKMLLLQYVYSKENQFERNHSEGLSQQLISPQVTKYTCSPYIATGIVPLDQ